MCLMSIIAVKERTKREIRVIIIDIVKTSVNVS